VAVGLRRQIYGTDIAAVLGYHAFVPIHTDAIERVGFYRESDTYMEVFAWDGQAMLAALSTL